MTLNTYEYCTLLAQKGTHSMGDRFNLPSLIQTQNNTYRFMYKRFLASSAKEHHSPLCTIVPSHTLPINELSESEKAIAKRFSVRIFFLIFFSDQSRTSKKKLCPIGEHFFFCSTKQRKAKKSFSHTHRNTGWLAGTNYSELISDTVDIIVIIIIDIFSPLHYCNCNVD